jgi:cobalt-zinc-cadmium efflux system protein
LSHHHHPEKNIKTAFLLNFSFSLFEIFGGLWTNSMAILSDAIHDLGDSLALGLAWYLSNLSHKKSDAKFSYGYKRFSLLGAIVTSLILIIGSIIVILHAIPRLLDPQDVYVEGMLGFAIIGIMVNSIAMIKMSHGHTQNEKMVSLHLLEDVLGWIAVLITSIIMLWVDVPVLDPLLSILISSYILWNVVKNLRQTVEIFLQATPEEIDTQELQQILSQRFPIQSIHDWHMWSMDGEYNILSFHIVLSDNKTENLSIQSLSKMKKEIRQLITEYGIQHSTIEFELDIESCDLKACC